MTTRWQDWAKTYSHMNNKWLDILRDYCRRRHPVTLPTDKQERKQHPITTGVLDYFPDAIAAVANTSFIGNQQHNPGKPMHWARHKSTDHADCIARHLVQRGTVDDDGIRHSAKVAWRALAMLQLEIEAATQTDEEKVAAAEPGTLVAVKDPDKLPCIETPSFEIPWKYIKGVDSNNIFDSFCSLPLHIMLKSHGRRRIPLGMEDYAQMSKALNGQSVHFHIAKHIIGGTSRPDTQEPFTELHTHAYIAGPMRGIEAHNFPAFDVAADYLTRVRGWGVISPADIDRAAGEGVHEDPAGTPDQRRYAMRDFHALYYLTSVRNGCIVLLPGWQDSVGATAERSMARWLGLKAYDVFGNEIKD